MDSQLGGLFVNLGPTSDKYSVLKELQDQTNIPIRIETSGERLSDLAYGGTRLSVGCTTGFTVRNSANVRGYATAGHCPNPQSYALTPTGAATNSATFWNSYHNIYADLEWSRANGSTPAAQFYGSSSTTRTTQTGTGSAWSGAFLCHRGLTTGYSCGIVGSTSYTPSYAGACPGGTCAATFVYVSGPNLNVAPGDSGGPWFSGGTAYGIHKGGPATGWSGYGFFSKISYLSNMGVSLL